MNWQAKDGNPETCHWPAVGMARNLIFNSGIAAGRPANAHSCLGGSLAVKPCDRNIKRTIEITDAMIKLADRGDLEREDTGCGILYGVLRDSAYKIKRLAEEEKRRHQAKGWWKED